MREAEGKFNRIRQGRGFAARVTVRVDPEAPEPSIQMDCHGDGWIAQGYLEDVPAAGYDDWKAGAVAGAAYALRFARRPECGVTITRILGLTTDTNPAAVGLAAAFAVWAALDLSPPTDEVRRLEDVVFARAPNDRVPDFG